MNRRLVGPTIITVALGGLVADYLYLSQLPWSVSRFLGRVLQVLAAIFTPSIDVANYRWLGQAIAPMSLIIIVLVVVWFSVSRVKRILTVTPDVALEPAPLALRVVAPTQARNQESGLLPRNRRQCSLMRRLVIAFSVVGIVFGAIVCLIVYSFLGPVIEKGVKSRTDAMVLCLREMVAPQMAAGRMASNSYDYFLYF